MSVASKDEAVLDQDRERNAAGRVAERGPEQEATRFGHGRALHGEKGGGDFRGAGDGMMQAAECSGT
jgi:hypothetical protein